jgi:hypothetical protein
MDLNFDFYEMSRLLKMKYIRIMNLSTSFRARQKVTLEPVLQSNHQHSNNSMISNQMKQLADSLPPLYSSALTHRLRLYQRTAELLNGMKHSYIQMDQSFFDAYESIYQDIRRTTKVLPNSIPDATWGFSEGDGKLTEDETKEHFTNECIYLMDGLKREMKEIIMLGSKDH